MHWAAVVGRSAYAVATIAFGVLHLVFGEFVTRVVPWWPASLPLRGLTVALVGTALVGAGVALLAGLRTSQVATGLGLLLLLSFAALGLPAAAASPPLSGQWTVAGKALALAGGAFLVAQASAGTTGTPPALLRLWALGPWCFGAFLALCGVQHFVHLEFVMSLVPSWIPGAFFWTCFTGVALVAAGFGVVVPKTAFLAGVLSSAMIGLWVPMVHLPRALAAWTQRSNETTAVFEALAMSGIALLVAWRHSDLRTSPVRHGAAHVSAAVPPAAQHGASLGRTARER